VRLRRHGAAHRRGCSARYGATGAAASPAAPVRRLHEGWWHRQRWGRLAGSFPPVVVFILILGAPGSGKGTQGKILAERLGLPKITTGDILRTAVTTGTPLGREAKKFMDEGKLVPDAVILSLIKEELAKPEGWQGAVLDGFPRT